MLAIIHHFDLGLDPPQRLGSVKIRVKIMFFPAQYHTQWEVALKCPTYWKRSSSHIQKTEICLHSLVKQNGYMREFWALWCLFGENLGVCGSQSTVVHPLSISQDPNSGDATICDDQIETVEMHCQHHGYMAHTEQLSCKINRKMKLKKPGNIRTLMWVTVSVWPGPVKSSLGK